MAQLQRRTRHKWRCESVGRPADAVKRYPHDDDVRRLLSAAAGADQARE